MKKIVSLALIACMMLAMSVVGFAAEAEYTLGMGVSLSTASSKEGNAQVDATVAAVVLDAEGKIVACRVDCAQSKMDVTDGAVDTAKEFKTKMELGPDYGMTVASPIGAEWDAQAKAFEEFVVGLTGAEVAALETVEKNNHNVAVDETLYAGCTMDITAFQAAVEKACNDAWAVTFTADEFTLGLAADTTAASSTAATDDEDGVVKMYSNFGAVVVADGKIVAALNDATQPNITIDVFGDIVDASFKGTKRELGPDYGMTPASAIGVEWDAQSAAFSAYVVGMNGEEVAALETQEHNGHQISVDETLLASCSMDITGMQAVLADAFAYAR